MKKREMSIIGGIDQRAILNHYLERLHATAIEGLSENQKARLLIIAIADFLAEELSLDALATIGNAIWFSLEDKSSDLALAAEGCFEANFYLRKVTENEAILKQFAHYMWLFTTYYYEKKGDLPTPLPHLASKPRFMSHKNERR